MCGHRTSVAIAVPFRTVDACLGAPAAPAAADERFAGWGRQVGGKYGMDALDPRDRKRILVFMFGSPCELVECVEHTLLNAGAGVCETEPDNPGKHLLRIGGCDRVVGFGREQDEALVVGFGHGLFSGRLIVWCGGGGGPHAL